MPEQRLDDIRFNSVSLAGFLAADPRPTLVFDLHTGRVEFTNEPFNELKETIDSDGEGSDELVKSLVAWARDPISSKTVDFSYNWICITVERRWRIVTCTDKKSSAVVQPDRSASDLQPNTLSFPEPHISKRPKISDNNQQIDERISDSLKRKNEDSPLHGSDGSNPSADWMQLGVQTLSPHVDLFCNNDWTRTPLGPMELWPIELRNAVITMLNNPDPRLLLWGEQMTLLYNEKCIPIIGEKHPQALGQDAAGVFAELWDDIKHLILAAFQDGKTTKGDQTPITLERAGFLEETYFQFILQPVLGRDGKPIAILDQLTEITNVVIAERRMNTIQMVREKIATSESLDEIWSGFLDALETNSDDIPFAALYCVESRGVDNHDDLPGDSSPSAWKCSLHRSVGLAIDDSEIPKTLELADENNPMIQRVRLCWKLNQPVLLEAEEGTLSSMFLQAALMQSPNVPCSKAVACPISSTTSASCLGFLILGLNPRRPYDEDYQHFVRLLNDGLIYSAASVALPKEYRQIQAAAEETALRHAALSKKLLRRTQEAEEMEAKFTRMASASPVGCYLLRIDGTPIYLNDAYYRITGIEKPSQLSFGADSVWREQIVNDDIPRVEKAWEEVVEGKRPSVVEYRLRREWKAFDDGTGIEMRGPTWLLLTAFPELNNEGEVQTVIGWVTDISLQKWTENLQTRRLAEALEAKRQSERFIDIVSHEMRNPLSAILQSADNVSATLQEFQSHRGSAGGVQPTQLADVLNSAMESAQTIVLCAQHQKRIVDDILTLSKLDAELLVLCPESVQPTVLIKKALKMYEAELENADIAAKIDIDQSYHDLAVSSVLLDPSRLLQVLINLLTNAIKFTKGRPNRCINITLRASSTMPASTSSVSYVPRRESRPEVLFTQDWGTGSELFLLFAVQDTGRGLEEEEVRSLFVRFAQANPRTNVKYGGSGLGLFISKELTELQGGQIGVSSSFGQGSTFHFYVKARIDATETREQLERAVLGTLEMPEQSEQTKQGSEQTSGSLGPDAEMNSGATNGGILIPKIGRSSTPNPEPQGASSSETAEPRFNAENLHVLVVEDNIINQKVMAAGLKKIGCTVHVANNGIEAINFLKRSTFAGSKHGSKEKVEDEKTTFSNGNPSPVPLSLILMDLEMPVMDGLTCIKSIRGMEKMGELSRHVPVAAVTANARTEQLNTALEYGMDLVITKPFRIPELLPKMRQMVDGQIVANRDPVFSHVERPN